MAERATQRGALFDLVLDLISEKIKKFAGEDKPCLKCPFALELIKEIRLARMQDAEEVTEDLRVHYGL